MTILWIMVSTWYILSSRVKKTCPSLPGIKSKTPGLLETTLMSRDVISSVSLYYTFTVRTDTQLFRNNCFCTICDLNRVPVSNGWSGYDNGCFI